MLRLITTLKGTCLFLCGATHVTAFTSSHHGPCRSIAVSQLGVLTERQMQFWEDVQDGLKDIEEFYRKKDMNIDRIWGFCQR